MRSLLCGTALSLLVACAASPKIITSAPALNSDAVLARSRDVFDAERTGDKSALESLLSERYVYLSSVGNVDRGKAEEIALQTQVTVQSYSIELARVIPLGPDRAMLRYFAHQKLSRGGASAICPYSGAIEIWQKERGVLRMVARTEWLVGSVRAPACT